MKKSSLYLLLCFLILNSFRIIGQNAVSQNADPKIALKEKADKAYQNFKTKNTSIQHVNASPKSQVFELNENDLYQGRRSEFLDQIIPLELPADFPVYNKNYGVKGYNQLITEYYKNHPTILKEALRYKLLPR